MFLSVAPSGVKISGPTEAKAEEKVVITCTTENSNPTAEIKWTIDKHIILNMTSKTEIAPEGGFITSSNVTFAINKAAQKVVAICQALNQKLTETIVGTHTINVICKFIQIMKLASEILLICWKFHSSVDTTTILYTVINNYPLFYNLYLYQFCSRNLVIEMRN